jgi:hypothetical protein
MKISKEKIMSFILESNTEIDEMGLVYNKSDLKTKSRPILDSNGNHIGHDMLIDLNNPEKGRVNVIFTPNIDEFIQNHPDLVEKLKQQYGNIKWAQINKPKDFPKYNPHRGEREYLSLPDTDDERIDVTKNKYVRSGEKYTTQQSIKRGGFNKIITEEFGLESPNGVEFNKDLSKRSIPAIIINDKRFIDRFVESWSNNKIEFRSHSYNTYETAQDFLKTVIARIGGRETKEMDTSYLARQFNGKYKNWEEDKKNQKQYQGKTDVFQLDKRGFNELNLDVSLKMIFEILGEKTGDNSFNWTINMKNKFGRKRPDEYRLPNGKLQPITLKDGGYLDEGLISVSKTVQLDPNKTFDETNTIMSDVAVSEGLRQAIYDFKQEINSIEPKSALKYATVKRSDLEKVNENRQINKIIKNVIFEEKISYETYHNSYTSAVTEAKEYAERRGYEINDEDSFRKIGMGPKKPSEGKTNRFSIELFKDGKEQKKMLHIQIYGMKNKYELNAYIN